MASPSDPHERVVSIFHGRTAGRVDFLAMVGDRIPGTTGRSVAEQICGFVPPGLPQRPTRRFYPRIATRFPATALTISRRLAAAQRETAAWWSEQVPAAARMTHGEAVRLLADGIARYDHNVRLQGIHVLCAIQPVYEMLSKLVTRSGIATVTAFMGGYGSHAESAVVDDMWLASRGELDFDEVVRRHGYHGPNEGEISGRVWRVDDAPLRRMLAGYRGRGEDASPVLGEQRKRAERVELERRLIAGMPAWQRPAADLQLRIARTVIPQRGIGKAAFLQSLDGARAAARRIGEHLAGDGQLADPEDVFYLTASELTGPLPTDPRDLVRRRRERRDEYLKQRLPESWQGMPVPAVDDAALDAATSLQGIGASPGIVEGPVRVVHDPEEADVDDGEILVSATTDPSWAALMFISAGLIVDIGGTLSHAAVVARELGIPCVVNTKTGTRALRTGDVCRVDGGTGLVEILRRAEAG
jgi:pyruvate,water dikinase